MARESDAVRHVTAADRVEADPSPGMTRERAIDAEGLWSGIVFTDPGRASGWHHHGEHETSIYVEAGRLRMEFGPGGSTVIEATAGDFLHVPKGAIHREINDGDEQSRLIVTRAGEGPTTINVDGPAAAS